MSKLVAHTKKVAIGVVGGIVVIIGIIAIPYPGPGWLIVFAGLGILSTEFEGAQRLLHYARTKFDAWNDWIKRQNRGIQFFVTMLTALVVVVTIWVVNGYGLINSWLHLNQDWLQSPLPWFHQ